MFRNVDTDQWFDPIGENALLYQIINDGDLFTEILELPQGFEGISVTANGITTELDGGDSYDFGLGVANFIVSWDSPGVADFPIRLAFSDESTSFTIRPINVPEPTTAVALGLLTAGGVVGTRRRR